MTLSEFYRISGVGPAELSVARTRIAQEAYALSPAPLRFFTPSLLGSGTPLNYFASTNRPAVGRNDALAARFAIGSAGETLHDIVTTESSNGLRPTRSYARESQAGFLDWVATVSTELVDHLGAAHALTASIAPLAGTLHGIRDGRVTVWYNDNAGTRSAHFSLFGPYSQSSIIVVAGAADATCAAEGRIDGEECTFTALTLANTDTPSSGVEYGFRNYYYFEANGVPADTLYIMQRRDGALGAGAGDFELLQTAEIDWPDAAGVWRAATYSIVPAASRSAMQLISSSASACNQNEVSCTGLLRNTRLPLENSLSDDGDAYESSWRHYLGLARAAASAADSLGDEWISVGYTIDDASERAWDQIERECGSVGTLPNVLEPLREVGVDCEEDTDCELERGERCINDNCVVTLDGLLDSNGEEDPAAARLAECLGIDGPAYIPFATLGSRPLCMWQHTDGSGTVYCEEFTGAPGCPYVMVGTDCSMHANGSTVLLPEPDVGETWGFVVVSDALGISRGQWQTTPPPGDIHDACNLIRDGWADEGVSEDAINRRLRGILPSYNQIATMAGRVGWIAEPMNLSHITLDRSPWVPRGLETAGPGGAAAPAATGILRNGLGAGTAISTAGWPCDDSVPGPQPAMGVDCSGARAQSMFCQRVDCDASAAMAYQGHRNRATINDRMARAVLALQLATGANMGNSRSPFWSERTAANWFTGPTTDTDVIEDVNLGDSTAPQTLVRYSHILQGSECDDVTCIGTRVFYGDAYCYRDCNEGDCPPIWSTRTSLSEGLWEHRRGARCVAAGIGHSDQVFIAFDPRRYDGLDQTYGWYGPGTSAITPSIWRGVIGGTADEDDIAFWEYVRDSIGLSVEDSLRELFYRVLRGHLAPETVVLSRRTSRVTEFTRWWQLNNESEVSIGGDWAGHERAPADGQFARGLTAGNFLDALELACELQRSGATECDPSAAPPEVASIRDLPSARAYFRCVAGTIEDQLDRAVLANVPRAALRGVTAAGGSGFRVEQGDYGASIVRYTSALEDLRASLPEVARQLRAIDRDIEQMEILLQQLQRQEAVRILELIQTAVSAGGECARGVGRVMSSSDFNGYLGGMVDAVATCATATATIAIRIAVTKIEGDAAAADLQSRIIDLNQRFDDRNERLASIARDIRRAVADLNAATVELTTRRQAARNALSRAALHDVAADGRLLRTNTVLRRRHSTARTRYRRAFEHAQRMSYLARLAIEQHIGMDLNAIQDDMTLVPRPSSWADQICAVTGIDYSRIRDYRDPVFQDYADQYVGEYVNLLERFVESYRIDYPFQDGRDTVVLSARDDIARAYRTCDASVGNLLYGSGDLDAEGITTADGAEISVWEVLGCEAPDPMEPTAGPCVSRTRLVVPPEERPFDDAHGHFEQATVYEVAFFSDDDPESDTRYTEDTTITQRNVLPAGRYRLSWYGLTAGTDVALVVTDSDDVPLPRSTGTGVAASTGDWERYFYIFDVRAEQVVHISWVPLNPSATAPQSYVVAAPMLERLPDQLPRDVTTLTTMMLQDDYPPNQYSETGLFGERGLPLCADAHGTVFRSEHWRRVCQDLCPRGFDTLCEGGSSYCYYETEFDIDAEAIASGNLFRRPGFARGNYNYRIDSIGLNFTGTASRVCSDRRFPDSCYSNGWIPYTLLHQGRNVVIDHYGGTGYAAPINPGRMENVRGLAAERYLTNPLSSADRALMNDYMQQQLRGRPLPGRYVLRVWDAPGVNFHGIEDVQVVLQYTYWTRQE